MPILQTTSPVSNSFREELHLCLILSQMHVPTDTLICRAGKTAWNMEDLIQYAIMQDCTSTVAAGPPSRLLARLLLQKLAILNWSTDNYLDINVLSRPNRWSEHIDQYTYSLKRNLML